MAWAAKFDWTHPPQWRRTCNLEEEHQNVVFWLKMGAEGRSSIEIGEQNASVWKFLDAKYGWWGTNCGGLACLWKLFLAITLLLWFPHFCWYYTFQKCGQAVFLFYLRHLNCWVFCPFVTVVLSYISFYITFVSRESATVTVLEV